MFCEWKAENVTYVLSYIAYTRCIKESLSVEIAVDEIFIRCFLKLMFFQQHEWMKCYIIRIIVYKKGK